MTTTQELVERSICGGVAALRLPERLQEWLTRNQHRDGAYLRRLLASWGWIEA